MDFHEYQSSNFSNQPYPEKEKNSMATASFILGLLALITFCTVYLPLIFGSLSILFAILSKGYEKKMSGFSITGTITSIISIVISIFTILATIFILYTNPQIYQEYKQQINEIMQHQYGISYDEFLQQYNGTSLPSD